MSEEKKQKLKEYQKKRQEAKKSKHNNEQNTFFNDLKVYLFKSILCNPYIDTFNKLFINLKNEKVPKK